MLKQIIKGVATNIPGLKSFVTQSTGGTNSARYCYSVWLRHMVMVRDHGLNTNPKIVAELGPGDSIGIGLAALISGCDQYSAFDVVKWANAERNLQIFDELVDLFEKRADIPNETDLSELKPTLNDYKFPHDIFSEEILDLALDRKRIDKIRQSVAGQSNLESQVHYKVPWYDATVLEKESVDMIFSQAVLEHVEDLSNTYRAMYSWLKPDGYMSHQIDFKCHRLAHEWNGHWTYSDLTWKLIKGNRPFLINREPHSVHLSILESEDFHVLCDEVVMQESKLTRSSLAPRFQYLTDDDLVSAGAFIIAVNK